MKIPSKGKTEMYDISDTEYASVKLDDSNKFWVTISRIEKPVEKDEIMVSVKDSNSIWFDTIDEVREYLLEKADASHKTQFHD